MTILLRLFRAECIKWRKSWIIVTMVLAPFCQTGFLFLILWYSEDLVRRFKPGFEFWIELNLLAWSLIFLPIMIALVSELSWDQELEARAWNHLLIQPVPRSAHYLVKLIGHLVLMAVSQIFLVILLVVGGLLLQRHFPLLVGRIPWKELFQFNGYAMLASVSLVGFHTWLSSRQPGLGTVLAVSFIGAWTCVRLAGTTPWVQALPWGMTSHVVTFFDRWNRHIPWEYFLGSLLCAMLWMGLGAFDFWRQKEPRR